MHAITELVTRGLVALWLLLVSLWFGVAPASPAPRHQVAPRPVRKSWGLVGVFGGRVVGVRIQLVAIPAV